MSIPSEKLNQVADILTNHGVDLWVIFVRETSVAGDPVLPLLCDQHFTWQSFFLLHASGERVAIVGRHDGLHESDDWPRVVTYVESPEEALLEEITRLDPETIGVNASVDDAHADGLSHGMYLRLLRYLDGTPYPDRLVSAAPVIDDLRGAKTATEIERMRGAIEITESILEELLGSVERGWSEVRVSDFVQRAMTDRGVRPAWSPCPLVTTGPDSDVGHGAPSGELSVTEGQVFHLDVGVVSEDYCSDLQRSWYVTAESDDGIPEDVQRAFDTVRAAIDAAFEALEIGIAGYVVDAASRAVIVDAGYEEYPHCVGHQVGRTVHDGGVLLGPQWERYGETVERPVEVNQVFTLELGVMVPGRGYLGLEDMVVLTDDGPEWLSESPRTLPTL
ncbi:MAG: Xaa-Pro peptidase family protein [Planctomycetota bacterium]